LRLNVLHITPDFNYACGRSYYVFLLLKYLKRKHNVYLFSNGGDSFERLSEENIPYKIIKGLRSRNPISFAGNIKDVRSFVIENSIDVIHTHHRLAELIGIQAKRLITGKKPKTVFTSLSLVSRRYNVEFKSDRIIAVSNTVSDMLTGRFKVNRQKIDMIPNFVDTDEIHYHEITALRTSGRGKYYNILAIGRFHHEKNFETLLKALSIIKNRKIRLILIGEGDNDIDYRKYIMLHDLNVEIIIPQKNLNSYFDSADICVLPSVRDPFPNFMLQAGLHKKPFIGANVDGIGELIKDGQNGLLFESRNEKELAEKILLFRKNKTLAAKCARNLHKDVINNYTQEFIIPKIEKLYRDLMK
jgi:glycosyltransferase involved in cell wall biosynthesis